MAIYTQNQAIPMPTRTSVGECLPDRRPEVSEVMEKLDYEVHRLAPAVDRLCTRLATILSNPGPVKGTGLISEAYNVDLAITLNSMASTLESNIDWLEDVIRRVEL